MELWHDYTFYSFIFLNSEKNEPRSAAAVIGFWGLSPQSPSGSAELASFGQSSPIFPPFSLRLHRPIKAESGDLACILTPSPYGHSPYIPCRNTGGERVNSITSIAGIFNPSPRRYTPQLSPIFCVA